MVLTQGIQLDILHNDHFIVVRLKKSPIDDGFDGLLVALGH